MRYFSALLLVLVTFNNNKYYYDFDGINQGELKEKLEAADFDSICMINDVKIMCFV